jgi:hypothetical protein
MSAAITIRVSGVRLDERTFLGVLPPAAKRLGMVSWTVRPGTVRLHVDPREPLVLLDATVTRMARHVGGTARREGFDGYRIIAGQQRVAA